MYWISINCENIPETYCLLSFAQSLERTADNHFFYYFWRVPQNKTYDIKNRLFSARSLWRFGTYKNLDKKWRASIALYPVFRTIYHPWTGRLRLAYRDGWPDWCQNQAFIFDHKVVGLQFHLEITSEGHEQMLEGAEDELIDAPFIQKKDEILKYAHYIHSTNEMMIKILNWTESTGAFGYPIREVTKVTLDTSKEIAPSLKNVKTIRFVLFNKEDYDIYNKMIEPIEQG